MNRIYIYYAICFFFLFSCTNEKKQNMVDEKAICLPGHIWIFYVGESNKITRFTLIHTSESDTSYFSSYRDGERGFADDKTFFDIYCNDYIASINLFSQLKEYMRSNDTHKEENSSNINNYSIKIECRDQCDTIMYVVNEKDINYFPSMIDSLNITDNELKKYLLYYHDIQNNKNNNVRKNSRSGEEF